MNELLKQELEEIDRDMILWRAENSKASTMKITEDTKVLALELSDATDDLNDAIDRLVTTLRKTSARPGQVTVGESDTLIWDGTDLIYATSKQRDPLRNVSREKRVAAAGRMDALGDAVLLQGRP